MIVRALFMAVLVPGLLLAQIGRVTHRNPDRSELVTVTINVVAGSPFGTGLGYAIVDVENLDSRPQTIDLRHQSVSHSRTNVSSHRVVTVEPGVFRCFMPVALPPNNGYFEVIIGGERHRCSPAYRHGNGPCTLFISDRSGQSHHGARILGLFRMAADAAKPQQIDVQSQDVPSDWRMFTSFSLIILDGESGAGAGLSADVQEALRQYVFSGGSLIVASVDSLPAGPLRDLGREAGDERLGHGLGSLLAIPPLGRDPGMLSGRIAQLPSGGAGLWPSTNDMYPVQEIEGLGRAPVKVFVLVILAFAILVGPVNFMVLKRRKKPLLALLIVPLAGFGTTAVILAYGVFHDGFGVRGAITTFTVLDQNDHAAVSVQARTLFAGIAPSEMTMGPGTLLLSHRAGRSQGHGRHDEWPDRWNLEVATQRLDGGILPSRTVTPLLTVQQGPARDRLTVRRSGDTLEVLPDGGFAPVGTVVLRDLEGQYWAGKDGVLKQVSAQDWARQFLAMRNKSREVRVVSGKFARNSSLPLSWPDGSKPGTYVCQVSKAPWLDDHGVDVDYDYEQHFVLGRMNTQDFVR